MVVMARTGSNTERTSDHTLEASAGYFSCWIPLFAVLTNSVAKHQRHLNMASDAPVVLFHYGRSPFSSRVLSYLALRGISYDQCVCTFNSVEMAAIDPWTHSSNRKFSHARISPASESAIVGYRYWPSAATYTSTRP